MLLVAFSEATAARPPVLMQSYWTLKQGEYIVIPFWSTTLPASHRIVLLYGERTVKANNAAGINVIPRGVEECWYCEGECCCRESRKYSGITAAAFTGGSSKISFSHSLLHEWTQRMNSTFAIQNNGRLPMCSQMDFRRVCAVRECVTAVALMRQRW